MSVEGTRAAGSGTAAAAGSSDPVDPVDSADSAEPADRADRADPVDLGGGCGGECAGCGVPAARESEPGSARGSETLAGRAAGTTASAGPDNAPGALGLARLTFLLGLLVGMGVTAVVGIALPRAMPFLAAAALVIVATAGITAVLRTRSGADR